MEKIKRCISIGKIKRYIFIVSLFIIGSITGHYSQVNCQERDRDRVREVVNLISAGPLQISELIPNMTRIGLYEKFDCV